MIRVHSSTFAGRAALALAASFLIGALACAPALAQAAKPDPKKQQSGQKPAAKKPAAKKTAAAKPDPKKAATAGKTGWMPCAPAGAMPPLALLRGPWSKAICAAFI